nr:ATP-binding protein [Vibrio splendidus]MCC4882559.1 ATP-binding protein [Vibrio splendidus]
MAVANDVYALASSALRGDRQKIESICKIIMAKEKDSSGLKVSLRKLLQQHDRQFTLNSEELPAELRGSVMKVEPSLTRHELAIADDIDTQLTEFLAEQEHIDGLLDFGLIASNRILLSGPPGNGKTSLAGAIAKELDLPFLVVDFANVIDSHLGCTGAKIAKIFRSASSMPCVLFLDEMETLLSERGGNGKQQEVGEIARIVSTLLLEIDRLSSQVVLIGATNHFEMLDVAVARRFNHHWVMAEPTDAIKNKWLDKFKSRYPQIPVDEVGISLDGKSLSDIENAVMKDCKRWAINTIKRRTVI